MLLRLRVVEVRGVSLVEHRVSARDEHDHSETGVAQHDGGDHQPRADAVDYRATCVEHERNEQQQNADEHERRRHVEVTTRKTMHAHEEDADHGHEKEQGADD